MSFTFRYGSYDRVTRAWSDSQLRGRILKSSVRVGNYLYICREDVFSAFQSYGRFSRFKTWQLQEAIHRLPWHTMLRIGANLFHPPGNVFEQAYFARPEGAAKQFAIRLSDGGEDALAEVFYLLSVPHHVNCATALRHHHNERNDIAQAGHTGIMGRRTPCWHCQSHYWRRRRLNDKHRQIALRLIKTTMEELNDFRKSLRRPRHQANAEATAQSLV